MKSQQAEAIIIADHQISTKNPEAVVALCQINNVSVSLQHFLDIMAHLENNKEPQMTQIPQLKSVGLNNDIILEVNEIRIRISKHLIQLRFPFIFRAIIDYQPLKESCFSFLYEFLSVFETRELILHPSFFRYQNYEIRNDWHFKRLQILERKIISESTSFKRTKLNIAHCLGNPTTDKNEIVAKNYNVWLPLQYALLKKAE